MIKRFIELHAPWQGAEITLEEALQVPIPKNEDFAWENIQNREVRAFLLDMRTKEIVSNVWIVSAAWRNEMANKWLFSSQNTEVLAASGKQVIIKT